MTRDTALRTRAAHWQNGLREAVSRLTDVALHNVRFDARDRNALAYLLASMLPADTEQTPCTQEQMREGCASVLEALGVKRDTVPAPPPSDPLLDGLVSAKCFDSSAAMAMADDDDGEEVA